MIMIIIIIMIMIMIIIWYLISPARRGRDEWVLTGANSPRDCDGAAPAGIEDRPTRALNKTNVMTHEMTTKHKHLNKAIVLL